MAVVVTSKSPTRAYVQDLGFIGGSDIADGVTDVSELVREAQENIVAAKTESGGARSSGGGEIHFPVVRADEGEYKLTTTVEIDELKNVDTKIHGNSRVVTPSGVDWAFYWRANGVFRRRSLRGGNLVGCGVRIENQSRGWHSIDDVEFKDAPHYAILLESGTNKYDVGSNPGGVLYGETGGSGGIVNGRIGSNKFTDCYGAVQCRGHQSDNWLVTHNESVRCRKADFQIWTAAWRFLHGSCEQRASVADGVDLTHPWINIGYSTATANILIQDYRFGNEHADYAGTEDDTQPPVVPITYGNIGESHAAHLREMRIIDCYFRGHQTGPSIESARHAIRLNVGLENSEFRGNSYFPYYESLIGFYHANDHHGRGNRLDLSNRFGYVSNRDVPLFNYPPSKGALGSWTVVPDDITPSGSVENRQLLRNTDSIEDSGWWGGDTGVNAITVVRDQTGPDGLPNTGYRATKTGTGSGALSGSPEPVSIADAWQASTAYSVGGRITQGTNVYECTAAGTSAASGGPVGSLPTQTDGGVTWRWVGPSAEVCVYGFFRAVAGSAIRHMRYELSAVSPDASHFTLPLEWQLVYFSANVPAASLALRIKPGVEGEGGAGTFDFAHLGVVPGNCPPLRHLERDSTNERRCPGGWLQLGRNVIGHGTALPIANEFDFHFEIGDEFKIADAITGEVGRYRCVAGGNPGTWLAETTIA